MFLVFPCMQAIQAFLLPPPPFFAAWSFLPCSVFLYRLGIPVLSMHSFTSSRNSFLPRLIVQWTIYGEGIANSLTPYQRCSAIFWGLSRSRQAQHSFYARARLSFSKNRPSSVGNDPRVVPSPIVRPPKAP